MEDGSVWSIDLVVIVAYLLGIMFVGIWSVWRQKLTGDVYFLAGRALGWPMVGAALFASNISTIHLVGLAQDGYKRGLVVGNFEWMATFTLMLLALVFAPFYFRSRISTLPEFLEKRYGRLARSIMAFMAILAAVLIHIGISLYAGSEVFEQFFGVPVEVSIIIISTVTAIYTVVGGLRAVVVTETIQSVILLGGAVLITALAVARLPDHDVNSWADFNRKIDVQHSAEALGQTAEMLNEAAAVAANDKAESRAAVADLMWACARQLKESEKLNFVVGELERAEQGELAALFADPQRWDDLASAADCFVPAATALRAAQQQVLAAGDMNAYLATDRPIRTPRLSMLRAEGPYYWLAILLGYPILGVWYWCSDQTIVQRVLGAKNELNAQNGALFAGLLKITPVFLMVLPGTVAYIILRDEIGDETAKTLPIMITVLMPRGLKGLMAAALMAALMSTIAAALNSVGTLVAKDIVGYFRPQTSDAAQVRVGRISAVVLMLLAMAWSTQGGKFGTIFEIINKIPALFLAPPITTVFLWGVFWRRGTKQAAVTVLSLGLSIGFCLFLVDTKQVAGAEWISDDRAGLGIPFMMQAVYMFVIWSVLYVVVSLATPAPPREQVENTTWPNPLAVVFRGRLIGWYDPRLLTAVLLVLTLGLYWVFR
jgi:Na+/proline symporter